MKLFHVDISLYLLIFWWTYLVKQRQINPPPRIIWMIVSINFEIDYLRVCKTQTITNKSNSGWKLTLNQAYTQSNKQIRGATFLKRISNEHIQYRWGLHSTFMECQTYLKIFVIHNRLVFLVFSILVSILFSMILFIWVKLFYLLTPIQLRDYQGWCACRREGYIIQAIYLTR